MRSDLARGPVGLYVNQNYPGKTDYCIPYNCGPAGIQECDGRSHRWPIDAQPQKKRLAGYNSLRGRLGGAFGSFPSTIKAYQPQDGIEVKDVTQSSSGIVKVLEKAPAEGSTRPDLGQIWA